MTARYRLKPEILQQLTDGVEPEFIDAEGVVRMRVGRHIHVFAGSEVERVYPPSPPQPDPGVYAIGDHIVASPRWDDTSRSWFYLGRDLQKWGLQVTHLTWEEVWQRAGDYDVEIVPLVPQRAPEVRRPASGGYLRLQGNYHDRELVIGKWTAAEDAGAIGVAVGDHFYGMGFSAEDLDRAATQLRDLAHHARGERGTCAGGC